MAFTAVIDKKDKDKVYIYTDIKNNKLLGVVKTGKVSESFKLKVLTDEGMVKTRVRFKLLKCQPEKGEFKLYRTNFEYFSMVK